MSYIQSIVGTSHSKAAVQLLADRKVSLLNSKVTLRVWIEKKMKICSSREAELGRRRLKLQLLLTRFNQLDVLRNTDWGNQKYRPVLLQILFEKIRNSGWRPQKYWLRDFISNIVCLLFMCFLTPFDWLVVNHQLNILWQFLLHKTENIQCIKFTWTNQTCTPQPAWPWNIIVRKIQNPRHWVLV